MPAHVSSAVIAYGGWDGHTPKACAERFAAWLEQQGYEVILSDRLSIWTDKEVMAHADLIVPMWTCGKVSRDEEAGVLEAVRNGAGLAGWHGGMCDAFREATNWQFMCGGQWVAHPGNIIPYTVNITKRDDPIVAGLRDFQMKSEQYYMHVDPSNEVLATTRFTGEHAEWIDGVVMPVVWKRRYGFGRVFYSSLGHVNADFDVPEALTIMQRGLRWATRTAEEAAASAARREAAAAKAAQAAQMVDGAGRGH